jgi:hypothetical protein
MSALHTVADVAAILKLKPQPNGKFSGAPEGTGATKDGFILCPEGNAFSNGGTKYTSRQVAELAGIDPAQYAPVAEFRAQRGHSNGGQARVSSSGSGTSSKATSNGTGATSSSAAPKPKRPAFNWNAATKFDYRDDGEFLFQVGKIGSGSEKQISQRRPDGAGGWVYGLGAGLYEVTTRNGAKHWYRVKDGTQPKSETREFPEVRRVIYRRDEAIKASVVFLVEGEGAAEVLNKELEGAPRLGDYFATTNPHGAGKWRDEYAEGFPGATVVVLDDNDEPGKAHGDTVCLSCHNHGATVKRVELPGLPPKGDVVDYFENGGTLDDILALFHTSPIWTPPAKEKRFSLLTLAQLKAKPKPQFLIHGLLVKADTSLLTAKHASFKSFIALDMALCVACDIPFHKHEVARGPVVYIAAEGAVGLTKRAQAWCAHHSADPGENFVVYDSPIQIHDAKTRADLIEEIAGLNPVLIVLDTLARCAVGLEENSSKDMGEFADALDALAKESGAHVMVVHHNNKGGDYRGSSAIPAAVGTHLSLERTGDTVTLTTEKQKDAEELQDLVFEKVEVSIPGTYGEESSLVFEKIDTRPGVGESLGDMAEKVLEEFKAAFSEDGATFSQWEKVCECAGINSRTFKRAAKELTEKGILVCPDKGKRGARYLLAAKEAENGAENSEGDKGTNRGHDPMSPNPSNEGDIGDTPLYRVSPCPLLTSERENDFAATEATEPKPEPKTPKKKRKGDKGDTANFEPYRTPPTEPATGAANDSDDDGERFE